jgi:hypothetical protein
MKRGVHLTGVNPEIQPVQGRFCAGRERLGVRRRVSGGGGTEFTDFGRLFLNHVFVADLAVVPAGAALMGAQHAITISTAPSKSESSATVRYGRPPM